MMTPDSESGKAVYPRTAVQMLAPIPLCFNSPTNSPTKSPSPPASSPDIGSQELVDIVRYLEREGVPNLATQILSYLSAEDLIS